MNLPDVLRAAGGHFLADVEELCYGVIVPRVVHHHRRTLELGEHAGREHRSFQGVIVQRGRTRTLTLPTFAVRVLAVTPNLDTFTIDDLKQTPPL